MDLCIFTWFGFRYPFNEIIKLIKNAGFQSVMTWWGNEFIETDELPKEKKPEVIRKNNLILENVHFPFSDINNIWIDSLNGQELLNNFIEYIDECKTHEIPTAVMHVSSGDNPPPFNQLGLDRFKIIIEKAEKENINIALENLRKPEYLDFIYKNIKSEKLKFCYDSGHENCFTPNYNFLDKYNDKLVALHLHDNDGTKDQHLLPFNGTINWKNIMEKLRNIEYKGSLALEIDSQFIDISKEYTAEGYLLEAKSRMYKLMDI
jgi:sugar phosphate isomerase/epimerase